MANFYAFYPPGSGGGSNASVGGNGQPAPTSSTQVGGENPSGNLQPLQTDNSGNLLVSIAAEPLNPFNTQDAADGTPGASAPAKAIQIGGTDGTDLRALSTDASGNLHTMGSEVDYTVTLTTNGQTQTYQTNGAANMCVQAQGSYTGWVAFYGSNDNVNWYNFYFFDMVNLGAQNLLQAGDVATFSTLGLKYIQAKTISFTGTANLTISLTSYTGPSTCFSPLAAGFKTQAWMFDSDGTGVTVGQHTMTASVPVAIASDQSAVPVSAASLPLPTGAATAANQTGGNQKTQVVDGSGNVQPSGDAVNRAIFEKITDGTHTANVTAAGALQVDGSGVTQPVSGTVTVTQGTGSNLHVVNDAGSAIMGKVGIDQTTNGTTNAVGVIGNSTSTGANSSLASAALEASHVIKAGSGRLYSLTGVNTKASPQYIQVFNSTTVPTDGTAPVLLAYVPSGGVFSWDFGDIGRYFSTGISVSNSSTAATKTIGSSDCWFNAEYL